MTNKFELEITYDEDTNAIRLSYDLNPKDIDLFHPLSINAGFILAALDFINSASMEQLEEVSALMQEELDEKEKSETCH